MIAFKQIFLVMSLVFLSSSFSSTKKVDLSVEETVNYINKKIEETAYKYPYSQIVEIKNGYIVLRHHYCTDEENAYLLRNNKKQYLEIGERCENDRVSFYSQNRVSIRKMLDQVDFKKLYDPSIGGVQIVIGILEPDFVDRYEKMTIVQKAHAIKQYQLFSYEYNFEMNGYTMKPNDSFRINYEGSTEDKQAILNALDYLFKLLIEDKSHWGEKTRDPNDPFSIDNYNSK